MTSPVSRDRGRLRMSPSSLVIGLAVAAGAAARGTTTTSCLAFVPPARVPPRAPSSSSSTTTPGGRIRWSLPVEPASAVKRWSNPEEAKAPLFREPSSRVIRYISKAEVDPVSFQERGKTTKKSVSTMEMSVADGRESVATTTTGAFDPFDFGSDGDDGAAASMNTAAQKRMTEDTTAAADNAEIGVWAARGILLLVAAIWATNFPCVKYINTLCFSPPCNHLPSEAALARFGLAAMVSLPLLFKQRRDVILAGLECGIWISLGYIAQSEALATISAGKCAFICSLTVVFVPIVSAILYGKPVKPMNLSAAAVALLGVGILEGMVSVPGILGVPPALAEVDVGSAAAEVAAASAAASTPSAASALASSSVETASAVSAAAAAAAATTGPIGALANALHVSKGDILALGQPIGFGYCFTRIEHHQEKFRDVPNRVLTIAAAQCVSVGLVSLLWVLHDYHGAIPDLGYMLEPHRMATVAWTGIVTTVFAIYLEGVALQKASAADAALIFSSEPVWASLFAFAMLHERLGANAYAGGAVILAACLLGAFADMPPPAAGDEAGDADRELGEPAPLPTEDYRP